MDKEIKVSQEISYRVYVLSCLILQMFYLCLFKKIKKAQSFPKKPRDLENEVII